MRTTPVTDGDQPIQTLLTEYVGVNEGARLLNLHPAALRARVYRSSIASVRVGSAVLIPRSEIERVQRTYLPRDLPNDRTRTSKKGI
jgi:hypothetical protein